MSEALKKTLAACVDCAQRVIDKQLPEISNEGEDADDGKRPAYGSDSR